MLAPIRNGMTFYDSYWEAAANAALRALREAEYVLVPAEFLPLDPRFAPLEYSWGLEGIEKLAWCCSKDDVDRLAPWLLDGAYGKAAVFYSWANEVFVLGGNFRWKKRISEANRQHLAAWFERVEQYRRGVPSRPCSERAWDALDADVLRNESSAPRSRVLIVGASGMGNVGDDLLANVLAEICTDAGAEAYLSGPAIDPLRVAGYDAVIVGGGGLVYARRDGLNEAQNLANYLKFAAIGRKFNVRTALIGVGDQEQRTATEPLALGCHPLTERFARSCLAAFEFVTTRDAESTELLTRFGARVTATGPDLLFHWTDRARAAVKPTTIQPGRIAVIGELYRHTAFAAGLGEGDGPLAMELQDRDFDVLIMSNDDLPHAERAQKALQSAGATVALVDLRSHDFDSLIFLFASYSGAITTRFHGLVLAMLADVPVLALDGANGKSARLLRNLDWTNALLLDGEEGGMMRLSAALEGRLERVPQERITDAGRQSTAHSQSVKALLGVTGADQALPTRRYASAVLRKPQRADDKVDETSGLPESGPVPLCWAASTPETQGYANLGDSLSAVTVAALSGRPVQHVSFDARTTKLVAVGSIGHAIEHGRAVVWGTGVSIRKGTLARNVPRTRYDIRAVRGPISARHYRDFGLVVPDVYGDPVWLLPSIVDEPIEPQYELGVIPHIRDVAGHHPAAPPKADSYRYLVGNEEAASIAVINTWHEPTWKGLLEKLRLIRSCKRIVSQSFHGVVIAEAYRIPVLNFRSLPGVKDGAVRIDLKQDCSTDPRVWEFYKGGRRPFFYMYSQRRDARTDWDAVIRAIDELWDPFEFDAAPLLEAFPLPLAYDPRMERPGSLRNIEAIQF